MSDDRLMRNLWIISTECRDAEHRYVVKHRTNKIWGVWDRQDWKYLRDREIEALSAQELREPF
jgi:hypothetical protein